jgi:hypothetical protein
MLINLISKIAEPLQCPDCDTDMQFLKSEWNKRVFLSTILERRFFLCPNCRRLSYELVAMPQDQTT